MPDEARHDGSLDVSDHRWLVVRTARGEVACSGAWRELVFGPHAQGCPDDDTARHLLEQAQRALFGAVLTELGHDDSIAMVEGVPVAVGQPLGCRVLVHAVVGKANLWMLVDATLMNAVLPEVGTVALADRKAAIRSAKLKLRVQLPWRACPLVSCVGSRSVTYFGPMQCSSTRFSSRSARVPSSPMATSRARTGISPCN